MMILTEQQLRTATGCTAENAALYLPFLQGTCKAFDITSPRRISGFLSQISHESRQLSQLEESLNYSVDSLMRVFGRHRISKDDAWEFGRSMGRRANQEAIANAVYGGAWGLKNLGNTHQGDGWKYRGRGLKQLTGRDNYNRCGIAIGEDFINYPERLLMPINACLSAGWFWDSKGLNKLADRGDVVAMTRVVNGGENGLDQRTELFGKAMRVFA